MLLHGKFTKDHYLCSVAYYVFEGQVVPEPQNKEKYRMEGSEGDPVSFAALLFCQFIESRFHFLSGILCEGDHQNVF